MQTNRLFTVVLTAFVGLFFLTITTNQSFAQPFVAEVIYQIDAEDFSNGATEPMPPASTSVTGVYAFNFSLDQSFYQGLLPVYVEGMDFVTSAGVPMEFDEANSGADIEIYNSTDSVRFTIGGLLNGPGGMAGLSEDFRVIFDASLLTFEPTAVVAPVKWFSPTDSWDSTNTTISLIDFQMVELPIFADDFETSQ